MASPRIRKEKRKVDDRSQQLCIGSHLFVSENAPLQKPTSHHGHQEATFAKHASNALQALSAEFSEGPTLLGNESVVEVNFGEHVCRAQPVNKKSRMHRVSSMPRLSTLPSLVSSQQQQSSLPTPALARKAINLMRTSASTPSFPSLVEKSRDTPSSAFASTNPETHLYAVLKSEGINVQAVSSLELTDYFLTMTEDNISAYGTDVISAVRNRDLPLLRKMHSEGRVLQCCNRFGESVLHMACRRGSIDVVRFLVEEAGVSFRVCDDYGRSPLHDACWTREPELELVKMLVLACPDLLLLKDKRGFTPLTYVRKDHWGQWCEFLEENRTLLTPTELLSRSN